MGMLGNEIGTECIGGSVEKKKNSRVFSIGQKGQSCSLLGIQSQLYVLMIPECRCNVSTKILRRKAF